MKQAASLLACLLSAAAARGATVYYDTYAAWGDASNARHGHLYLYTGAAPSTDYFLYATGVAGTTINNLVQTQAGIGPYQPVTEYPNADGPVGFGNSYFKLRSTQPMTWEVDENTSCHCGDAHGMVAAADNQNSYLGTIFMTFLRKDTDPEAPGGSYTLSMFGDQLAVISAAAVPITAEVRMWTGAAWGAVLATSPSIPAGGVWMWSPDQSANKLNGGTLAANAGHYRVDLVGGQGLLYKGNVYSPMPFLAHGYAWNRDNAVMVAPDMVTGRKIGTDLVGAVVADHGSSPQVIVTNAGTASASFELRRFMATLPGLTDSQWPVDGDDPSGTWAVVATVPALAAGARWTYTSPNDGYFRVVSTGGSPQPLEAIMGTALTRARYAGGDYIYATDTQQAIGKTFHWWGHQTAALGNLEIHVVAPWAGTQVTLNATGMAAQVQTSSGPDQGLVFFVPQPAGEQDMEYTITSTQYVYAWFMSNTGVIGTPEFGETFFSNPPMPQDLVVAEKSASLSTASLGDTVTYLLTVRNVSAGPANSVWIWDTVPTGMTLQYANPPPTVSTPPLYGWDMGIVAALTDASVTMAASVDTAVNGEVKNNTITVTKLSAPNSTSSPNAPVRVLIPGADLQKTADVATAVPGDTITYTLNYFNSAAALPSTPRLDLEVRGGSMDGTNINFKFRVSNYSGAPVALGDLKICYWVQDPTPPASFVYSAPWYGGQCNPCVGPWWDAAGGTFSRPLAAVVPAVVRPDSRSANIMICWSTTDPDTVKNLEKWENIDLQVTHPTNSWSAFNQTSLNYSRRPGGEGSYVQDSHFCLYYQNNLVSEYTDAVTADPNSGCEPQNWVSVWDSVPAEINYLGSTPTAASAGPQPVLSWFDPCVDPQESRAFTFWGTVKAGTAQGTVINNRGNAQANSITAISNLATVLVPIVGTFTDTPTVSATPTISATPTTSRTATPTLTATATPTSSATPSNTASVSPTSTPTQSLTHTFSPTPPPTPTPLPTPTPTPPPLLLSPLPSSPSPGGPNGLYIAYRLSTDAAVNIRLFTVAGEKVRDLDPFNGRRGPNEQFWDGKNSAGAAVGTGVFITHIVARSPQGEERDLWGKVSIVR